MALKPTDNYSPVPSVLPETQQPGDSIRVEASPQDFGSQIGGAMQQAGQTGEKLGDEATDAALQMQAIYNKSASDQGYNQHQTTVNNLLYGDPNNPNDHGYMSLTGADAMNARAGVMAKMDASRQTIRAGMNQAQQIQFDDSSRRLNQMVFSDIGNHANQQFMSWSDQTQGDTQKVALNGLGAAPTSDQAFQHNFEIGMQAAANQAHLKGLDTTAAQLDFQNQAYATRAEALGANDPVGALSFVNANQGKLNGGTYAELVSRLQPKVRAAQASGLGAATINAADSDYGNYVEQSAANAAPGSAPLVDRLDQAIHGQESGGAATAATSVTGARGGHQIQPGTFAQYAKPGESIDSDNDNAVVGKRIIADYVQKYAGDPARVAVAYFSGPGNVSPPGSAVPYINDAKDPTGKSTSSYVQDVMGKLGGVGGIQTKADYYRTNYSTILNHAQAQADALHPDDPTFAQQATSRVEQQMNAVIRQQELSYKADNDTVYQAFNGDLSKGTRPVSVDQLRATSPAVAQAWDRLQQQQPEVAHTIATSILTQNAKNNGGDAKTYGAGYYDVFNRIHAADGAPGKINDAAALYSMVGQPGGLTMAGLEKARGEIAGKNTPDAEAESAMRATLFRGVHGQLTGSNNLMGIKDPKGEEIFLRFSAQAYQQIESLKAQGKTPQQIYNPDSPDYVGKLANGLKRSSAQVTSDLLEENNPGAGALPPAAVDTGATDLKSRDGILAAYRAGKLSRADAGQALVSGGFAMAAAAPPAAAPAAPAGPVVPVN